MAHRRTHRAADTLKVFIALLLLLRCHADVSAPFPTCRPPATRPLRNALLTDATRRGAFLMLNVSWTQPEDVPVGDSPCRADLDTAVWQPRNDLDEALGAGCAMNHRFNIMRFSGDDAFAPGWEAYMMFWPREYSIVVPEKPLVVYAAWFGRQVASAAVSVTVRLIRNGTVAFSDTLDVGMVSQTTTTCAALDGQPIAQINFISPSSPLPFVISQPEDESTEPSPSLELEAEPSVPPEPEVSSNGTVLRVVYRWTDAIQSLRPQVSTPFFRRIFGDFCDDDDFLGINNSEFVSVSPGPYDANPSRVKIFDIFLDQVLKDRPSLWSFDVKLYADWLGDRYTLSKEANVTVLAQLFQKNRGMVYETLVTHVYPGFLSYGDPGSGCPGRRVGAVSVRSTYVYGDNPHRSYKIFLSTTTKPDERNFERHILQSDELDDTPEALLKWSNTSASQAVPREEGLRIRFSWPVSETDLDTAVRIGTHGIGRTCYRPTSYFENTLFSFSGDSVSAGGREMFLARLELARAEEMWSSSVDVDLFAFWFGREKYANGSATVEVWYNDGAGGSSGYQQAVFNPVVAWGDGKESLVDYTDGFVECRGSKVARVRVTSGSSGEITTNLMLIASGQLIEKSW